MISTADHRIHHSTNPAHYNKNYGMVLNIYDKIFSTYFLSDKNKKIEFGIEDSNYNRNLFFSDIFIIPIRWVRGLINN